MGTGEGQKPRNLVCLCQATLEWGEYQVARISSKRQRRYRNRKEHTSNLTEIWNRQCVAVLPGCITVSVCLSLAMPSHETFLQVCVMHKVRSQQPSDEPNILALVPVA